MVDDPDLRFSPQGKAVARLRLVANDRKKEGDQWVDGDTLWINATVFGKPAENAAESLKKGDLVVVTGRLRTESWESDGQKKSAIVLIADQVAADLTFRVLPHGGAGHAAAAAEIGADQGQDPWATPVGSPEPGF